MQLRRDEQEQFIFKADLEKETILQNRDNYNFKLKLINDIFNSYEDYQDRIRKKLLSLKFNKKYVNKTSDDEIQLIEKRLHDQTDVIHTILTYLTPRNAWIIEKCYLDKFTKFKTTWYEEHFSKTTFYKYKREAVDQFVNYFYDTIIS
ncbi:hypothetical protein BCF59_0448 [Mycoplasmopsis mustelae]|uniref:Uncharacterized protein n=1 Tax=Mycoplasmopsis mustelae TaxID=171289 RepID=A0A4R7UEH1_9BACT|nr:hypothetical protein [Mycoplasmopsis mustelae]TDV24476.1 hypothetical protein BCF59_0448 [Mycoplasmopsis mustelae]